MAAHHAFRGQDVETGDPLRLPCAMCGKVLWHEDHWDTAAKAKEAYEMLKVGQDPTLPAPPKFSSIEEADEWLAKEAVRRGLAPDPDKQLVFHTQEEADDYLRRMAGEPYVPDGWITVEEATRTVDSVMDSLFQQTYSPDAFKPSQLTKKDLYAAMEQVRQKIVPYPETKVVFDHDMVTDTYKGLGLELRAEEIYRMGMLSPKDVLKGFSVD